MRRTRARSSRRRSVAGSCGVGVDSIGLERGDLDHVVVTRRGGVLALDSKWRNQTTVSDTRAMAAAAHRVRQRAEAVARSIMQAERARHRARVDSVRVRPAVVVWGAEQYRLPGGVAQVDGIDFVAGSQLRGWLRQLDGEVVTKAAAAQIEAALVAFRDTSPARRQSART